MQEYRPTKAGRDLKAVVEAFGVWGQKWIETRATPNNLDPSLWMRDRRHNLDPSTLPDRRTVLAAAKRNWWLVADPTTEVDLCAADPGYDVGSWATTDLRTITAIWMGLTRVKDARDRIQLAGDPAIARSMQTSLGLGVFSSQPMSVH